MKIGDRQIGAGGVYVIAELGVNHDGSVERALELTRAAHAAGAHAIKLQYFETDRLMSKSAKLAAYQKAAGETDPIAMLRRVELTMGQMRPIVGLAHELHMHAIVTVFSTELVDQAERLAWDAYKTASPDLIHRPLVKRLIATGKPLIVSTGAANKGEVLKALEWLESARDRLALMHCVSCYPTRLVDASIAGMFALARLFDGPIGYSDHTPDDDTSWVAKAAGANLLEKHLTYDRNARGPDHAASLDPRGFARYVEYVIDGNPSGLPRPPRNLSDFVPIPSVLLSDPRVGEPVKRVLDCERDVRAISRQSVVARRDMRTGDVLSAADVTIKRPGTGIPPAELDLVPGKRVRRDIETDTVIAWEDLS